MTYLYFAIYYTTYRILQVYSINMWSVKHICCHLFIHLASLELFSPVCLQWCNLEHSHAVVSHCRIFHTDRSHSILYMVGYWGISNVTECTHTSVEKALKLHLGLIIQYWFGSLQLILPCDLSISAVTEWGLAHWQSIAVLFSCHHCLSCIIATHMWNKHCSASQQL